MAIVDNMFCPLHREGTIFMWYVLFKDGTMVYEYDDRKVRTKWDKIRMSYLEWLENATQRFYRREISTWDNIKRMVYLVFDNILCSIKPELLDSIVETKFYSLKFNEIEELGIMGNGGKIYFSTKDGIIHLDGDRDLNVFFMLGDKRVDITNNHDVDYSKNLIERHYASYDFNLSNNGDPVTSKGNVDANGIGYTVNVKALHKDKFINFKCELIYVLPLAQPNYIMLSITSEIDIDIELHLTFLANDDKNVVHLEKGKKQTFTIAF